MINKNINTNIILNINNNINYGNYNKFVNNKINYIKHINYNY